MIKILSHDITWITFNEKKSHKDITTLICVNKDRPVFVKFSTL